MENKEKKIKEMAKEFCPIYIDPTREDCELCKQCSKGNCDSLKRLKKFIKNYFPEDSVVLSREEYDSLKSLPSKIIKYMDRHLGNGELCGNVVRKCAKQFGVEIKES